MDDYALPGGKVIKICPEAEEYLATGLYDHAENVSQLLEVPVQSRDIEWIDVLDAETAEIHCGLGRECPEAGYVQDTAIPLLLQSVKALEALARQGVCADIAPLEAKKIKGRIFIAFKYIETGRYPSRYLEHNYPKLTDDEVLAASFKKALALAPAA